MATTARLAMTRLDEARCEALFASGLQPSDALTAETVTQAINRAIRRLGVRGCVAQMAQEFGDHPDAAARRMRWVRQLVHEAARPQAGQPQGGQPQAGSGARLDGHDVAMRPVAA